ncbi:serine hydrolase domain-containing protein [Calditrichota bacterium]
MKYLFRFVYLLILLPVLVSSRPLQNKEAEIQIRNLLEKTVIKAKQVHSGVLLVHSDKLDIHLAHAAGVTGENDRPVRIDDRFHTASIGKAMTAVLVMKLVENGKLSLDDLIHEYLPSELLNGLFILDGEPFVETVQIKHLLNHTSGVGDWYEDKPKDRYPSFIEQITADPSRSWTTDDVLEYHRAHLTARFLPGEDFHYSDTGYYLLGKLIEALHNKPLHEVLNDEIFEPLEMRSSSLFGYSEPLDSMQHEMLFVYMDDREISHDAWLPADWGGGGVVTTLDDLFKFHKALVDGELVALKTLEEMQQWVKWQRGIRYGYGLVNLRIRALTFVMSSKYDMWGNWGSISTFMFYNPHYDVYLVGAFNQSKFIQKQVVFMIRVLNIIAKME